MLIARGIRICSTRPGLRSPYLAEPLLLCPLLMQREPGDEEERAPGWR
jgi:hypothetical protein